jgi:hypothetical protein
MKIAVVVVGLLIAGGHLFVGGMVAGSYLVPPTGIARMGDR